MSNMCLVVTPAIEELASKIQQEYPEACQRNGFNNQMCAEWIGLYNNTNSKNPDNVPAMKSLVNFIEKLRNQEGKSFLVSNNNSIFAENLNTYGKENAEGLPLQRMDLANLAEIEGELKEAASIFEGGENSPSQSNERSSRETNEQKQRRLEKWAKENNFWVDSLSDVLEDNFGTPIEGGGEAVVYDAGENVVKSISLDYYDGNPQAALDRILLHNYLFPDTQLTDIGFGRDSDGTFKILVSQPYIKGRAATRDEIIKYAKGRGFYTTDNNSYYFRNIRINDLNELNVIIGNDGIPRVIDAELRFDNLAPTVLHEEIPVELLSEMADEEATITALDSRESSDPDLNKKFGGKTEVSVSEMLGNLLELSSPFEDFIKALQENIGELGDIKIQLVPNSNSKVYGIAGLYSSLDNTIYINRNANYKGKDGKVDNTIIHEIIHAIVANSLNTPKHREELGKLFDEAKEKILKKYDVESFDELPEYLKKGRLYGLQNLDEFAAEFFTNSEFILELNDENTFGKRSNKKSLFNRLVEWIKSLLPKGVTETYKRSGEILEDIILNSGGNIQANRNLLASNNNAANTQQASTIEPRFKQGIETLTGYYEGGGRLITDDYPGVPKELDDKLNNHFMGGEELSDDDYRELAKYISVVQNTDANTSQSWPYIAVPKQQTQQQSKFNVSQAEFYSGAAMGSDTAWATEARKRGIKVVEYTPGSWDVLSQEEKNKYDAEYREVVDRTGRSVLDINTYKGKLVRRDMMQADSADAIFAIGTIGSRGFVEGGTGYATTRGIIRGIPVFVYDRRHKQWKVWSDSSRKFITTSIPTLTPHAAVIGTRGDIIDKDDRGRDIYDIKEEEKQVIRDVLTKTVGQQPTQQPSSISSPSQAANLASPAAGAVSLGDVTPEEQAEAQRRYEEANTPKPKPVRPQSDSFKTALKVTENRTTQFYQTFTPQQIKDRGVMIADYFSDIIDDYLLDEIDI